MDPQDSSGGTQQSSVGQEPKAGHRKHGEIYDAVPGTDHFIRSEFFPQTADRSPLIQGRREEKIIEAPELEAGIPFAHDEIISIHSQEPTLEDMFIQYTGRGLS